MAGQEGFLDFLRTALPDLAEADRPRAGEMIAATLSALDEHISERSRTDAAMQADADALAAELCAYLERLRLSGPTAATR